MGGGGNSTIELINSTLAENDATDGDSLAVDGSGTKIILRNSILVGIRRAAKNWNCGFPHSDGLRNGIVEDGGHNIQYPDVNCNVLIPSLDPLLELPANNGGSTTTISLKPGSPAIGKGDPAICASVMLNNRDQRGYIVPAGVTCDIGAYQSKAIAPVAITGTPATLAATISVSTRSSN